MKSDSGDLLQKNTPLLCVDEPEAVPWLRPITHVYTDLDGTLLAPSGRLLTAHDGTPSTAVTEALVALKRAGIEVIIVTGRSTQQGSEFLRLLNLQTFIGDFGCMALEGVGMKQKVFFELGDWANTVLVDGLAPGELPDGITPYQLILRSGVIERLTAAFPGKLELHTPFPDVRIVTHAFRGLVDNDKVARILAAEALPLELADNGEIHPQVHTLVDCPEIHIYHLVPRGSSKALAVKADMERRGVSPEQALAIGDAVSDIEMGDYVGTLVVMGNALHSETVQKALKARAARFEAGMWDGDEGDGAGPPRQNEAVTLYTQGFTADGWVEFAQALLAAQ